MSKRTTKRIAWSYPSSLNAVKFGLRGGCWTIEKVNEHEDGSTTVKAVKGFREYDDAKAYADAMSEPWDSVTK